MKKAIFIVFLVIAVIGVFYVFNEDMDENSQKETTVCIEYTCFQVEVAESIFERAQGLMGRESLAEDRGMLFVFDAGGLYPFWMKNVQIPLDIIWIDDGGKIVYIERNATPCEECESINPGTDAKYVLEINGGLSEKKGFGVGDEVRTDLNLSSETSS
ncbi:MAG: DUF192 domain-containing protein [Candidatus Aenigmarchaeota archaeon]|nr:DUF192 domain-containing protein [Candidatus Aenigmarchaeota archaeon]